MVPAVLCDSQAVLDRPPQAPEAVTDPEERRSQGEEVSSKEAIEQRKGSEVGDSQSRDPPRGSSKTTLECQARACLRPRLLFISSPPDLQPGPAWPCSRAISFFFWFVPPETVLQSLSVFSFGHQSDSVRRSRSTPGSGRPTSNFHSPRLRVYTVCSER